MTKKNPWKSVKSVATCSYAEQLQNILIAMKIKPQILLWTSAALMLLFFGIWPKSAFDIQLHDTYFVIAYSSFGIFWALVFCLFGLIYFYAEKKGWSLNKFLSQFHAWTTFLMVVFGLLAWKRIPHFMPQRWYVSETGTGLEMVENIKLLLIAALFIFILAQVCFLMNILISFFRK